MLEPLTAEAAAVGACKLQREGPLIRERRLCSSSPLSSSDSPIETTHTAAAAAQEQCSCSCHENMKNSVSPSQSPEGMFQSSSSQKEEFPLRPPPCCHCVDPTVLSVDVALALSLPPQATVGKGKNITRAYSSQTTVRTNSKFHEKSSTSYHNQLSGSSTKGRDHVEKSRGSHISSRNNRPTHNSHRKGTNSSTDCSDSNNGQELWVASDNLKDGSDFLERSNTTRTTTEQAKKRYISTAGGFNWSNIDRTSIYLTLIKKLATFLQVPQHVLVIEELRFPTSTASAAAESARVSKNKSFFFASATSSLFAEARNNFFSERKGGKRGQQRREDCAMSKGQQCGLSQGKKKQNTPYSKPEDQETMGKEYMESKGINLEENLLNPTQQQERGDNTTLVQLQRQHQQQQLQHRLHQHQHQLHQMRHKKGNLDGVGLRQVSPPVDRWRNSIKSSIETGEVERGSSNGDSDRSNGKKEPTLGGSLDDRSNEHNKTSARHQQRAYSNEINIKDKGFEKRDEEMEPTEPQQQEHHYLQSEESTPETTQRMSSITEGENGHYAAHERWDRLESQRRADTAEIKHQQLLLSVVRIHLLMQDSAMVFNNSSSSRDRERTNETSPQRPKQTTLSGESTVNLSQIPRVLTADQETLSAQESQTSDVQETPSKRAVNIFDKMFAVSNNKTEEQQCSQLQEKKTRLTTTDFTATQAVTAAPTGAAAAVATAGTTTTAAATTAAATTAAEATTAATTTIAAAATTALTAITATTATPATTATAGTTAPVASTATAAKAPYAVTAEDGAGRTAAIDWRKGRRAADFMDKFESLQGKALRFSLTSSRVYVEILSIKDRTSGSAAAAGFHSSPAEAAAAFPHPLLLPASLLGRVDGPTAALWRDLLQQQQYRLNPATEKPSPFSYALVATDFSERYEDQFAQKGAKVDVKTSTDGGDTPGHYFFLEPLFLEVSHWIVFITVISTCCAALLLLVLLWVLCRERQRLIEKHQQSVQQSYGRAIEGTFSPLAAAHSATTATGKTSTGIMGKKSAWAGEGEEAEPSRLERKENPCVLWTSQVTTENRIQPGTCTRTADSFQTGVIDLPSSPRKKKGNAWRKFLPFREKSGAQRENHTVCSIPKPHGMLCLSAVPAGARCTAPASSNCVLVEPTLMGKSTFDISRARGLSVTLNPNGPGHVPLPRAVAAPAESTGREEGTLRPCCTSTAATIASTATDGCPFSLPQALLGRNHACVECTGCSTLEEIGGHFELPSCISCLTLDAGDISSLPAPAGQEDSYECGGAAIYAVETAAAKAPDDDELSDMDDAEADAMAADAAMKHRNHSAEGHWERKGTEDEISSWQTPASSSTRALQASFFNNFRMRCSTGSYTRFDAREVTEDPTDVVETFDGGEIDEKLCKSEDASS